MKGEQKQLSELSTEEKILAVAAQVFTQKGYEATKTRDIAEAAGINIASLHYYFRSKEKLFDIVIGKTMMRFSQLMGEVMNTDDPLHVKIRNFVPYYIDFIDQNPFVPMFILSESQRNAHRINEMMNDEHMLPVLKKQIEGLVEGGVIRPISIGNFFCSLVGMVIFPYLSQALIKLKLEMTEEEFDKMLEERRAIIPDMMINYLYLQPPE
ncbi:MAG: TetR/AcrR family transcriptional regulator [Bacteroidota bacterium]